MTRVKGSVIIGSNHIAIEPEELSVMPLLNNICKKQSVSKSGKTYKYAIGIDASTTCTGICLSREDNRVHVLIDLKRDFTPKIEYTDNLRFVLSKLLHGLEIECLVVEKPIRAIKNHATSVLQKLGRELDAIYKEIPELNGVQIIKVLPASWKHAMNIKSKGTNRFDVKECLAEDITDRYPIFQPHFNRCMTVGYGVKDFDSFDATGILRYYLDYSKDEEGKDINIIEPDYRVDSFVAVKFIDKDADEFENLPPTLSQRDDIRIKAWNTDKDYYTNIKMASTSHDCIVMKPIGDMNIVQFCWESLLDIDFNRDLLVIIMRATHVTKTVKSELNRTGFAMFNVY